MATSVRLAFVDEGPRSIRWGWVKRAKSGMFISGASIFRAEARGRGAVWTRPPPLYSRQRACPAGRRDRRITRRTAWDIAARLRDGHVRPQVRVSVRAHLLRKLILGPLLLLQGWHTPRVTP